MQWKKAVGLIGGILAVSLFICEYLIYYVVQYQVNYMSVAGLNY
jgi:hypothetical protein